MTAVPTTPLKPGPGAALGSLANADMMSDLKIFTVRDLERHPARVLESCDAHGEARIRCRDGRTYLLKPEAPAGAAITQVPDLAARRARLFPQSLSRVFARRLDQALAGE
jgi:hypothetical protein